MSQPYFTKYEHRKPSFFAPMSEGRMLVWQFLAGATIAAALWYLTWRWCSALNPDAFVFSVLVAGAETLFFVGSCIFFYDIWAEGDTPQAPVPSTRKHIAFEGSGQINVDLFITTYNEAIEVVEPSIRDACQLHVPKSVCLRIYVLDDGNRAEFVDLARRYNVHYLTRETNEGYKAGNLRNALSQTQGDFVIICDADTRVFETFLDHTLGYFQDPNVAWVQTPHWFYDLSSGRRWQDVFRELGWAGRVMAACAERLTGQTHVGRDPYLADPALFFDVIQRRRNRHGASFCCGAGSIHRREALYETSLLRKSSAACKKTQAAGLSTALAYATIPLQPFKFHVSEDIYTSILLQADRENKWRSVYHPQVVAKMLSPCSLQAWASQQLKYAGGTYDIMLRDNPIFQRGMPWRIKLHYLATFWSYLSVLWMPVLLFAPVVSLLTGLAPVEAYSIEFFAHFLPVLILNELALMVAAKGHDIQAGRMMAYAGLPRHFAALWMVLRGRRPSFKPTPKLPGLSEGCHYLMPHLVILLVMAVAGGVGVFFHLRGAEGFGPSFMVVNIFWLLWNAMTTGRIVLYGLLIGPNQESRETTPKGLHAKS